MPPCSRFLIVLSVEQKQTHNDYQCEKETTRTLLLNICTGKLFSTVMQIHVHLPNASCVQFKTIVELKYAKFTVRTWYLMKEQGHRETWHKSNKTHSTRNMKSWKKRTRLTEVNGNSKNAVTQRHSKLRFRKCHAQSKRGSQDEIESELN